MKKAIFAVSAAIAALGLAPGAHATVVEGITLSSSTHFDHFEGKAQSAGVGLTDSFTFSLDVASSFTSAFIGSVAGGPPNMRGVFDEINFKSISIDGEHVFDIVNGFFDSASIAGAVLAAGDHTLTLVYDSTKAGVTYSGDISISPAAVAVPEPATWALMVAGIVAVGVTMRRRSLTGHIAFS